MSFTQVSLEQTQRFQRLILDYIKVDSPLDEFYELPNTLNSYKQQIANRSQFPVNRPVLSNALLKQYEPLGGAQGVVQENIELLKKDTTFTITTGHQLNIFTGPLYFIYKIIHTIKLAKQLDEAYPSNKFVPIYWMNSEDHDIEEVGQFNLFGKKYIWETEQTGATGKMNPDSLAEFCSQLKEVFLNNSETLEMVAVFEKAYTKFNNLALATRYFANELFSAYGLVIIDSDDAALKQTFTSFIKTDITSNTPYEVVLETSKELEKRGYKAQVNPRQINSFYLHNGTRNRIVKNQTGYKVLQTSIKFTEAELLSEIDNHPERFSPNVVLRPLFQEFILPNLAYVGGAGELAYWLQYKRYFNQMQVSFPILSLRNHFLLIDKTKRKQMEDLQLTTEDMFDSVDELIKQHVLASANVDVSIDRELDVLNELYDLLKTKATEIDFSLLASLDAERARSAKNLSQWESRFSRALKKKNEVSVNRIQKINKSLFPHGYLQERHDNFLEFYAKSNGTLINQVYTATRPFYTGFSVMYLA